MEKNKKERLIETALEVVHRQGFHMTTLAAIADQAAVPLGNVYYYFKTKEALGRAMMEARKGQYETLIREWENLKDPRARIEALIEMTVERRDSLALYGCPIGTLCSELHKSPTEFAADAASVFGLLLVWLTDQFRHLVGEPEASNCALHLLAALQGVSLLAHSFHDPRLIGSEALNLKNWIRSLIHSQNKENHDENSRAATF